MDLFLAISQGIGTSLAAGVRAFLAPLHGRRCSRARTSGWTSRAPSTSSWSPSSWLGHHAVADRGRLADRARGRPGVTGHVGDRGIAAIGGVLFAGLARGGGTTCPSRACSPARSCALVAFAAARASWVGAEERLAARGESGAAHDRWACIADAVVARCRGSRGAGRAGRVPGARVLRVGACWCSAAAPARSTKASESCVERQARPRRRRRPEAGDARAGGRRGQGADVRRDHAPRPVSLRTA